MSLSDAFLMTVLSSDSGILEVSFSAHAAIEVDRARFERSIAQLKVGSTIYNLDTSFWK